MLSDKWSSQMITLNDSYTKDYVIGANKNVPDLYPEASLFTAMPSVFATGYLVGLMEWACMEHLAHANHHDDTQITLGLGINITHDAPCTEGTPVQVRCVCIQVGTRSISWNVAVYAKDVLIGHGTHKRVMVEKAHFVHNVNEQTTEIGGKTIE